MEKSATQEIFIEQSVERPKFVGSWKVGLTFFDTVQSAKFLREGIFLITSSAELWVTARSQ
jgi:hypothetical protein